MAGNPLPDRSTQRFTITSQQLQSNPLPNGSFAEAWKVSFVTADGTQSYVIVPRDQYNAETVAALITRDLDQIEAVAKLGGA